MRSRKLASWPVRLCMCLVLALGRAPEETWAAPADAMALRFEARAGAPPALALTAEDGTGLRLVRLQAKSVVDDPLAFTELHAVFENPEDRILEGRFEITLPPAASLSRFAMKVGPSWQEGEVVEKQRARRVYEDFLHRKQDPALLETARGNVFGARVFPIAPRSRKELIVSYSQIVTAAPLSLVPLASLPELQELELVVHGLGTTPYRAHFRKHRPTGDLVVDRADHLLPPALRSGELVAVGLRAPIDRRGDALDDALVLIDTSASGALDLERRVHFVEELGRSLSRSNPGARLSLIAFDQETETIFNSVARDLDREVLGRIERRGALGASNYERALAAAAVLAKRERLRRLVVLGDGIATAGASDVAALSRAAAALAVSGIERIDAIATAGLRDQALLEALTRAALPRAGVVSSIEAPFAEIEQRLRRRTHAELAIEVAGADWYEPRVLRGLQSGDEFQLFAKLSPDRALTVRIGAEAPRAIATRSAARPLLERAWAKARIDGLLAGPLGDEQRRQIVQLSTRHRVISPFTALLVLETDSDYQRFAIEQKAPADVLSVVDGKLVMEKRRRIVARSGTKATWPDSGVPSRSEDVIVARPPTPVSSGNLWGEELGDSFGTGGLGLIGGGSGRARAPSSGPGTTHGRMGAAHRLAAPRLRMGATTVSGRLPPEVIQRIVRQNFGRFRVCYERGLGRNPRLSGRVSARFVIGRDGSVVSASDAGSTLDDDAVIDCVLAAFRLLEFPRPPDGVVTVVYPILFSPGGELTRSPPPSTRRPQQPKPPEPELPKPTTPYEGRFGEIMDKLAQRELAGALAQAESWRRQEPANVMALLGLGEALEASGSPGRAARAYGSLIDLFPARADLRRYAGARLERVAGGAQLALDTFEAALKDRPDHAISHRLTAYALVRQEQHARAFQLLAAALERRDFRHRAGVDRILRDDLGLIAAAWLKTSPDRRGEVTAKLRSLGAELATKPSLRFVLSWETDASDVDLHVYDGQGGHAFYGRPALAGGGELYADVQNGYGPEAFAIEGRRPARLYTLQAHYYARGPMGFGMGKLQIVSHDGKGRLALEERPFVVMRDQAYVDLGTYGVRR